SSSLDLGSSTAHPARMLPSRGGCWELAEAAASRAACCTPRPTEIGTGFSPFWYQTSRRTHWRPIDRLMRCPSRSLQPLTGCPELSDLHHPRLSAAPGCLALSCPAHQQSTCTPAAGFAVSRLFPAWQPSTSTAGDSP